MTVRTLTDPATFPALRRLSNGRTVRTPISRGTTPANGSLTIYSDTSGAPGVVTSIWMTLAPSAATKHAHLQVFVDNEIIPSIDIDLGTLFLAHLNAVTATFLWSTTHMHGEGGSNDSIGGVFGFPIPYGQSCVVKLVNPDPFSSLSTFTQVDAAQSVAVPYRLRSMNIPYAQGHTLLSTDVDTMFTTPSGSAGWLVWFAYVAIGTNGVTYLERNIELSIDGEASPSIVSTGGEDFFLGSYYFQGRATYSTPDLAVSYLNQSNWQTLVGLDVLSRWGGFKFNSQLRADLTTKSYCVHGHTYGATALFYTPATAGWAQPVTAPAAPTPPWVSSVVSGATSATVVVNPSASAQGSSITGVTISATPTGGGLPITASVAPSTALVAITGLATSTPYAFTVTATNAVGTSASSPAVVATTTTAASSSGTISPDTVSGLIGWWKADTLALSDGAQVSSWADSSTSNKPFTQATGSAQPIYKASVQNGLPAVRFNGTSQFMALASALASTAGAYTVLGVWQINQAPQSNVRMLNGADGTYLISTNGKCQVVVNAGGSDAVSSVVPLGYHMLSAVSGTGGNSYVNGQSGTSASVGTAAPATLNIGRRPSSSFFGVDICEIVVYSGALSSANRQGVEQYLAFKWGLSQPAKT